MLTLKYCTILISFSIVYPTLLDITYSKSGNNVACNIDLISPSRDLSLRVYSCEPSGYERVARVWCWVSSYS